jgi:hydroxymethylglutaryl-CoA lyase
MSSQPHGTNLGRVEIFEMGPRDGLQNEKAEISVDQKVALVDCLSRA